MHFSSNYCFNQNKNTTVLLSEGLNDNTPDLAWHRRHHFPRSTHAPLSVWPYIRGRQEPFPSQPPSLLQHMKRDTVSHTM